MIKNKNVNKFFFLFIFMHVFIWTLIPSLVNINLPLDTIEALAWGSDLAWGFNKHPPFSAFAVEVFYQIFGNQDWSFYLLSQIFVGFSFFVIFKFAEEFLGNLSLAFLSVLLIEGIFFYNFTTPEFNVNISQLPFWALTVFFSWRCIKNSSILNHIFLGLVIGLGLLSKYLFIYLVIGVVTYLIYMTYKKKKINVFYFILTSLITILIISPHLIWLYENDFSTITYGIKRSGGTGHLTDHIVYPLIFLIKQFVLIIPFIMMGYFLLKKIRLIRLPKDEKVIFLFSSFIIPIFLIFLTSFIMGAKIRTMWMTPFYLFSGVFFILLFKKNINFNKLKKFNMVFIFFFLLSPIIYSIISLSNDSKRTDYPGKEIARLVQNKWDDNFSNSIKYVVGDEWYAGNLSYHLYSRPKWKIDIQEQSNSIKSNEGVVYTGNPKVLKKICPGVYGTIRPVGYCMIGKR